MFSRHTKIIGLDLRPVATSALRKIWPPALSHWLEFEIFCRWVLDQLQTPQHCKERFPKDKSPNPALVLLLTSPNSAGNVLCRAGFMLSFTVTAPTQQLIAVSARDLAVASGTPPHTRGQRGAWQAGIQAQPDFLSLQQQSLFERIIHDSFWIICIIKS